ncbi:MAG TPA: hypothetical protein VFW94_10280 [Candidatus Acidoferrales bacterium]|nr:hypothetical protein [Candidatus Acidoferrales bacterium]
MDEIVSLQGPVEKIDGKLFLRIPLEAGGDEFVQCSRGISEVKDGCLVIEIKEWLAGMLRIEDGDLVHVDNRNGKFNVTPVNPRPVQ